MTSKSKKRLATFLPGWLGVALFAIFLTACGANDSDSPQDSAAESKTAKNMRPTEATVHLPKFKEIKLSPSLQSNTTTPTQALKAAGQSAGLLGGYLETRSIWNSHRISVCWENPSEWDEQERQWAKEAVTAAWDAHSDVTFVDWTTCRAYDQSNPYLGLRMAIVSDRPVTRQYGEAGIGFNSDVKLNLDFRSFRKECSYSSTKEICVKNAAIHEFGHVLAFAHEQDRLDTPQACIDQVLEDEPTYDFDHSLTMSGPYDPDSIMNYCVPGFYDHYLGLSAGDITMLQKYYGKPGSKIYSVFTANDPPTVSIQDSKTFEDVADYITIPNANGNVLHHFYATPDGNKVAYTLVNQQKGNSILGYIDTQTDTLQGQKAVAEEVLDMKLSSDSKYAYIVWKQGTTGGLRAYDLSTLTVSWDFPLAGAKQIAAQRDRSSHQLYVVQNSGTGSAQSIVVVDTNSHTRVASYSVGITRSQPLVIGLTPDEKTLYLADPGADNALAPFIANLDTQSGQYNVLQPVSPADAGIHDLHVLDSNQVLLATNKQGIAPLIYTVDKKSFGPITDGVPSDWSLPYVYSPDGKTVFTTGQYWDGGIPYYSFIRLDSYRLNRAAGPVVWDGFNHPVWSAGFGQDVVSRPFAVIYR
jgi:hypothetical protein